jgi:hypothetical protein
VELDDMRFNRITHRITHLDGIARAAAREEIEHSQVPALITLIAQLERVIHEHADDFERRGYELPAQELRGALAALKDA